MLVAIYGTGSGAILYGTGTGLIRYLYVISSFKDNIQKVFKRDNFVVKSFLIGESFSFLNVGYFYYLQMENSANGRSPMMVYQACMNPWDDHTLPMYMLLPLNQFFLVFLAVL